MTLQKHLVFTALGGIFLVAVTQQLEPFRNYQLATMAAYLCATAGLTLLTGLNGQISLGHGALMAVGAYTMAFAQNGIGNLYVSLLLAMLATTAAGAIIGVAAARLRGPYLAGLTLAVALAVPAFTVTFDGLFNSEQGLPVSFVAPETLPIETWQALIAGGCALLVMFLLANVVASRFGRAMRAVRDNEVAARLAGIHVARTQVLSFVVSAAPAGLGGALLAFLAQNVSPGAFSLTLSLFLLLAIVIGGLGNLAGAVWGAFLLVALPDLTSSLTSGVTVSPELARKLEGNLALAIFGLTLIVVMLVVPGGLQSLVHRISHRIRKGRNQ